MTNHKITDAIGFQFEPKPYRYDSKEAILYALSVGVGQSPTADFDLRHTYEFHPDFQPLPTFAAIFPFAILEQMTAAPGLENVAPMMLLHGEQYLELKRPLPASATLTNHATISQIYDKGRGALVIADISSRTEAGEEVALNRVSIYVQGAGGFGGERGPSSRDQHLPPDRPADVVVKQTTQPNQALLYRLSSGDRNPIHADPNIARMIGFERPILHGLCTFGFAGRAVLEHYCADNPGRFHSMQVRFARHVFPGETIITELWQQDRQDAATTIFLRSKVAERDEVVLSNGIVILRENG
jgi:(3R)-3-hydroxyacyl-CoA dehydrogenase / 3a,7a,12a-trihydroxy-5b-cholest-24-enoyl-CoA hydratase / enoyl-CoA hydratase 2